MRKVLLILACFIAWNVNPAVAERIRINLGCQKIDNKPIAGGHTKAPIRIPAIYQDGYLLNLPPSHPDNAQTRTNYQYCLETATFTK